MKKYSLLLTSLVMIAACITTFLITESKVPKVAYVDLEKIYNDFTLKKELESKLNNVKNARKLMLDSLQMDLSKLSGMVKSEKDVAAIREFQIRKQQYLQRKQDFEQDNERTSDSYTTQIWNQLNQYVRDYGKEKQYTYILGMNGSGTVMYAAEEKDVTSEVSGYVNRRYNGEQK